MTHPQDCGGDCSECALVRLCERQTQKILELKAEIEQFKAKLDQAERDRATLIKGSIRRIE